MSHVDIQKPHVEFEHVIQTVTLFPVGFYYVNEKRIVSYVKLLI